MTYNVLGVNSGMGVSLYPFKEHVIANIECRPIFHTPKDVQWRANFGETPLFKALMNIGDNIDLLVSSPDCGSGSILRMSRAKKYGDHKENKSLAMFFTGVDMYKPKFILFENLDGLFKSFPEADFDELLADYRLIKHSASVKMWGNSQIYRKRLIIVGIRKDLPEKIDKYFKLPDLRHKNKTCFELYGDLDQGEDNLWGLEIGHVRENPMEVITIYAGKKMRNCEITEYWQTVLKGKKRWEVTDRKFNRAPGVYRNNKRDYPATARKANRQFDHNGLMLTPRQLARVQGVPDDFKLVIEQKKLNYWINKTRAVVTKTPPMEISKWFKRKLEKCIDLWQ
jgi:site-specific DNA-cytosine methylase